MLRNDRQQCGINADTEIANTTKTSTPQYLERTKETKCRSGIKVVKRI